MSKRKARVKAYPKEFREQVVQIARTGNRRLAEVAAEFEVSTDALPTTERRRIPRPILLHSRERFVYPSTKS